MDCVMSHHHDCRTLRENIMRRQQQQAIGAPVDIAKNVSAPSLATASSDTTSKSILNNHNTPPRPSTLSKHDSEPVVTTKSQLESSSLIPPPLSSSRSSSSSSLSGSSPMTRSKSYDFMFPWTSAQINSSMSTRRSATDPARGFLSFNGNWRYDREQRRVIIGRDPKSD